MKSKLSAYLRLMRFDKPIGIFLLFWPVCWAMILTRPAPFYILIFCLGVFLMRAAGCVANDLADRKLDKWVVRTQNRPLTCGEIPVWEAYVLLAVLFGFAASLLFFLNQLCVILAIFAAILTLIYPLCKRFMDIPQIILGITFNMGVLMVYAQTQGGLSTQGLTLYTAAALWTIAYDTLYAMADKADDLKVGIKSSAIWFGEHDFDITSLIYAGFMMNLVIVGLSLKHPWYYHLLWLAPFSLVVYLLIRVFNNRDWVFEGFKFNFWVGVAVTAVFGVFVWGF